ncbi:hypothetical protein ILUMI_22948 [Ignelater luminosus]|uniref:Glucose-methanol-choline oxidoreductase N-terminal domain-containing protein n=1 Tax=Ignelater luminosus TaxID=2038154 RepID=A0A8K0CCW8_IGNLU|nr:hypothetical protein ILUMI_22948 [Ignelater luminosus]
MGTPTRNKRFFQPNNEEAQPVDHGHYHFIIVSAESGKLKVLLLKAGGRENDFTDVPGFAPFLVRSDINWGYKTMQQKNCCLSMKNKQCNYPRGKAVGGTSVINFMMYIRGNKEDFDNWGSENSGWDYESVLPYFRKPETASLLQEDPGYHEHQGPLSIKDCRYYPDVKNVFLQAAEQRGHEVLDYNGNNQNGYSTMQMTTIEVGKTFYDHALYPGLIFSTNLSTNAPNIEQYIRDLEGHGPLTSPVGVSGVGFGSPRIKSKNPRVEYSFAVALIEEAASLFIDFLK